MVGVVPQVQLDHCHRDLCLDPPDTLLVVWVLGLLSGEFENKGLHRLAKETKIIF